MYMCIENVGECKNCKKKKKFPSAQYYGKPTTAKNNHVSILGLSQDCFSEKREINSKMQKKINLPQKYSV